MGDFSTIHIRFQDSKGKPREVVVDFGARGLQAIFLRGAESEFVITKKGESAPIPRNNLKPDGVRLLPEDGLFEGPGRVCYIENGVLKCWFPS